jgi:MFS family permease
MHSIREIRTFESLKLRGFRLLWQNHIAAAMGMSMDQAARSWLIYSLTHSAMHLGMVNAVRGAPLLIFGIFAGTLADRIDRRKLLYITQLINAFLNFVLATLILMEQIQIWHIYVTGFLAGAVMALQQPSRQSLLNDLVGKRYLMNAIALSTAAMNVSKSVGPAVAGLLIQYFGIDIAYYGQAAAYVFASIFLFQIHDVKPDAAADSFHPASRQSFLSSLKEGFVYVYNHKIILALMVLGLAPAILAMPYQTLMPMFAVDVFHGDAVLQGILLTTTGAGAILGSLIMASMASLQGSGKFLIIAAGAFGLSLIFFSQASFIGLALVSIFLCGMFFTGYAAQDQTIIQLLTPAELRGRVLGVYFLDHGLMPLGSLLAGALAAWLGAPWAVTLMGGSCLLLVVGVAVFIPGIWKLSFQQEQHGTK